MSCNETYQNTVDDEGKTDPAFLLIRGTGELAALRHSKGRQVCVITGVLVELSPA